ncbi:DUF1992 domain-containing protein [Amycolatopsis sp. 195334CR]|uniref:DnaJ family domain-containing protein n=1 Tax=Amycolatopsis sp. 195334CR TaxID=2814588 RepID=UPI001A8EDE70|nr:DUF1992 domain-containing protein [Amycolatopsis sp. 195334CR]MBN6039234.1 DUF1992 domain-containing protein [Amycolatopsis sp. 195334CR]
MTERKPPGVDFESWVDRQIRVAQARGEFDDLPGQGKPLPGLRGPRDEHWWLKDYLRREGVSAGALLPESLLLRKELERLPEVVRELRTEAEVREHVRVLNRRIAEWMRMPTGPAVPVGMADADEVVETWRAARVVPAPPEPEPDPGPEPRRASWFSRLRRRRHRT